MPSLLSRLAPVILTLRGSKIVFSSERRMLARVAALQRHPRSASPPRRLRHTVSVSRRTVDGWTVYEVSPLDPVTPPDRRALYLHGGAYVFEISPQHWTLIAELAVATNSRVTVPIVPVAPTALAAQVVPAAARLATRLIEQVGAERTTVLGDSAGGGLALAVAMTLRDDGVQPPRVILISPWLDITGTDPEIRRIQPKDPWLAVPGARAAGRLYAGDLPDDDWRVSPIHGSIDGLGEVLMLSGTHDILNADAHRLVEKAAGSDLRLEYVEQAGMVHVYPLLAPMPEAVEARRLIRDRMLGKR